MGEYTDESFAEAERTFENKYDVYEVQPLGEGTYGKVFKAFHRRTGEAVALKKMKLDTEEEGVPSTAIREIALLKEIDHENIVKVLDVFCSTNKLTIVFEFLENDLKKYMKTKNLMLCPEEVVKLSFQLIKGLEVCHASRILHRDLKPQNLLVNADGRLKIADFGLSRAYTVPVPKYTHEVVTVWYRAPEILLGGELYSVPVDVWSVGCILGEMASGKPLFAGDSEIGTIFKVFQKLGTPTVTEWPALHEMPEFKATFPQWKHRGWGNIRNIAKQVGKDGVELLDSLLAYDPKRRCSARRAKNHPYFRDMQGATGGHAA